MTKEELVLTVTTATTSCIEGMIAITLESQQYKDKKAALKNA